MINCCPGEIVTEDYALGGKKKKRKEKEEEAGLFIYGIFEFSC